MGFHARLTRLRYFFSAQTHLIQIQQEILHSVSTSLIHASKKKIPQTSPQHAAKAASHIRRHESKPQHTTGYRDRTCLHHPPHHRQTYSHHIGRQDSTPRSTWLQRNRDLGLTLEVNPPLSGVFKICLRVLTNRVSDLAIISSP
jgi:hypothetical protein